MLERPSTQGSDDGTAGVIAMSSAELLKNMKAQLKEQFKPSDADRQGSRGRATRVASRRTLTV